jgi:hypothetical protein
MESTRDATPTVHPTRTRDLDQGLTVPMDIYVTIAGDWGCLKGQMDCDEPACDSGRGVDRDLIIEG